MTEKMFKKFGKDFQEKLVLAIIADAAFSDQIKEVLKLSYFDLVRAKILLERIFEYKEQYGEHPGIDTVSMLIRTEFSEYDDEMRSELKEFFLRLNKMLAENVSLDYVKDKAVEFCKKQHIMETILSVYNETEKKNDNFDYEAVHNKLSKALGAGAEKAEGYDYKEDFDKRFEIRSRNPVTTGWPRLDEVTGGGLGKGELGIIIAPSGCHAKGEKILMYDGTLKPVEDIQVGDKIMGPDSKPRLVLELHRGLDHFYEISPKRKNLESFDVNVGHILSLKVYDNRSKKYNTVNVSVRDYLEWTDRKKSNSRLYFSDPILFVKEEYEIDPYVMGLALGDRITASEADKESIEEIVRLGVTCGSLKVVQHSSKNSRNTHFRLNLLSGVALAEAGFKRKRIPEEYFVGSLEQRKELIAGLVDTEGWACNGAYRISTSNAELAKDIVRIARSVGYYASTSELIGQKYSLGYEHQVYINHFGDPDLKPRLQRNKNTANKQEKPKRTVGFDVVKKEIPEDYYGFTVDRDNLYVMGNFYVTHNSGKSMVLTHLGAAALRAGKNVIHYTLELNSTVIGNRYDSCITKYGLNELLDHKEEIREEVRKIKSRLIIVKYPMRFASTETIRNSAEKISRDKGFKPDLIVVDYGDLLKPIGDKGATRHNLEGIYEELRGLAGHFEVPLWTASQTNRKGLDARVVKLDSINEAYSKIFPSDLAVTLGRTPEDKESNSGRFFVAKNRNGQDGIVLPLYMNTANVQIKVLDEDPENSKDDKSLQEKLRMVYEKQQNGENNG